MAAVGARHQLDLMHDAAVPGLSHGTLAVGAGGRVQLDLDLSRHEVTLIELLPCSADEHPGLDDAWLLGHGSQGQDA